LRGRPQASAKRRGRKLSPSAHGAKLLTLHGPLGRLLGGVVAKYDSNHK